MILDIIKFLIFFLTLSVHYVNSLKCPPGTFLYTQKNQERDFCVQCPAGTVMPYKDHEQTQCKTCEKIRQPDLEILVSPCNKTHDAVIHCVNGYYRDQARNPRQMGKCEKCSNCKFTGRTCQTYSDAICCMEENFEVIPNQDGIPVCVERPWFCRRGQYFQTTTFECLPCPPNTFMSLDYHTQPECLKCNTSEFSWPLHSVVIRPCNRTHEAIVKCKDNFFMNPRMGYSDNSIGCSPCTVCSATDLPYEGRKCDGMNDTLCCPQANMTVLDTPDGPLCKVPPTGTTTLQNSPTCGDEQYLSINVEERSVSCKPCKERESQQGAPSSTCKDYIEFKNTAALAGLTGKVLIAIAAGFVIAILVTIICTISIYHTRVKKLHATRRNQHEEPSAPEETFALGGNTQNPPGYYDHNRTM